MLTNRWVPIIDPQSLDSVKQHPIATGPFKFVSWKRLHTTVMARHDTYWKRTLTATPCHTWTKSSASPWPTTPCG